MIVILRSDKTNKQPWRKTFVLLGCERSGKYKKYKTVVDVSVTGSWKCDCPFKLRGKPSFHGDGWMLKVICGLHNHALSHTLVDHPYAGRLKKDEHELVLKLAYESVYKLWNGWFRNTLGGVQMYCRIAHFATCIQIRIDVAEWVVPQQK